jgi:predicted nucleic acid-binding protein
MIGWLLDTNILLETIKPRPEPKVVALLANAPLDRFHVSIVTIEEIRYGIERTASPERWVALHRWLAQTVRPMFECRILPIDEDTMLKWRHLLEAGRRVRHTFSQPDLFIAATALHHGLTVLTRNTRDFEHTGVPVLNPWTAVST